MNNTFLLFYSPKPHSQVRIQLINQNWSIDKHITMTPSFGKGEGLSQWYACFYSGFQNLSFHLLGGKPLLSV